MFRILKFNALFVVITIAFVSNAKSESSVFDQKIDRLIPNISCSQEKYKVVDHKCRCIQKDNAGNCISWTGCGSHNPGGVRG